MGQTGCGECPNLSTGSTMLNDHAQTKSNAYQETSCQGPAVQKHARRGCGTKRMLGFIGSFADAPLKKQRRKGLTTTEPGRKSCAEQTLWKFLEGNSPPKLRAPARFPLKRSMGKGPCLESGTRLPANSIPNWTKGSARQSAFFSPSFWGL